MQYKKGNSGCEIEREGKKISLPIFHLKNHKSVYEETNTCIVNPKEFNLPPM